MENVNAIIFDFGGVIFNIDFDRACRSFETLGVTDFAEMYSLKKANPLFQQLEEGKLSEQAFYSGFRKLSNTMIEDDQIKVALNNLLVSYRKDALQTLKTIRGKYKLFLLSNTNSIHLAAFTTIYHEQIGKGSLEDYFDNVYYSHITGYRKPAKEAYEIVLKENHLSAGETLFIDDSFTNINGAKALGLQTIHLKEKEIQDLGL